MGPRASQDLRSPSLIMAPGETRFAETVVKPYQTMHFLVARDII